MTKTEVKNLEVGELRSLLQPHFEDDLSDFNKKDLRALVDSEWDEWLAQELSVEESAAEPVVVEGKNLNTDLYTGRP